MILCPSQNAMKVTFGKLYKMLYSIISALYRRDISALYRDISALYRDFLSSMFLILVMLFVSL